MGSSQRLPSGNWRCRVHIGEGKYKSFTARTKKEAEQKAFRYVDSIVTSDRLENGEVTVEQYLNRYIDSRKNIMSPTTLISYRSMVEHYFDSLKRMRPGDLTSDDVQREVNDLAIRLSAKTVRNAYGLLLSAVGKYAPSAFRGIMLPKKYSSEIIIPETEEVKQILEFFKGTRYELPFSIAAWCGLRRGELCALTYADIDPDSRLISVTKSLCASPEGGTEIKAPKTRTSKRKVFCPKAVVDLFRIQAADHDPQDRIVDVGITRLYIVLREAQEKIGIPPFRLHDLRHFACSLMISLGYPYAYIKDQLGHSSEKMINQVYGHVMQEKQTALFQKYDEEISRIIGE